ncbi:MAG: hypothetical protein JRJ85_08340 [Deltaproteobacteria bacterium]|nr:hypothetical protein [Deltaproteobacteria bacterium]
MGSLFRNCIEQRGWKVDRFTYIATQLAQGIVAVEVRQQAPEMQSQMAGARAAIESNPAISEEMKQQMLSQMALGMAETKKLENAGNNIPASEMTLIRAHQDRIKAVFATD